MALEASSGEFYQADDGHVTPRSLAEALSRLFRSHDRGAYQEALEACTFIDRHQFPFLEDAEVRLAAEGFVDALLAKDRLEFEHLTGGDIDTEGLAETDYTPVRVPLRGRAAVIGADHQYARDKATAWKRHKTGGDYWTPFMWSQVHELRAILRDPGYPYKPRAGASGPGPEAVRYILAFELHDKHTDEHWDEGVRVMTPYFAKILAHHDHEST